MKKHIDCVHTTTKKFCCQICGRCFGRNDHLKVHTKTHERKVMLSPTSQNDSDSALVTGHNLSTRKQTGKKTHRGSDEEDNGMAIIEERRVVQVGATFAAIFWSLFYLVTVTNHLISLILLASQWLNSRLMALPLSEHEIASYGCFRNHRERNTVTAGCPIVKTYHRSDPI